MEDPLDFFCAFLLSLPALGLLYGLRGRAVCFAGSGDEEGLVPALEEG